MSGIIHLVGFFLRLAFDRRFRREWDLECALEDEGEDGPTVRAILAKEGAR